MEKHSPLNILELSIKLPSIILTRFVPILSKGSNCIHLKCCNNCLVAIRGERDPNTFLLSFNSSCPSMKSRASSLAITLTFGCLFAAILFVDREEEDNPSQFLLLTKGERDENKERRICDREGFEVP